MYYREIATKSGHKISAKRRSFHCAVLPYVFSYRLFADIQHERAQVGAPGRTEDRVDDIFGQRGDDAGERTADDNTDRHVHHVAAQREGLEFFEKLFHFFTPFFIRQYRIIEQERFASKFCVLTRRGFAVILDVLP